MTYDDKSVSPDGAVVAADAVLLRKEFHDDGSVSELPEQSAEVYKLLPELSGEVKPAKE